MHSTEQRPPRLDHRELSTVMGIFASAPDVGAGLPLWLPAGSAMRLELEDLARDIARRDGCQPVHTPVLAKRSLFERSGHWAKFAEDMFPPMAMSAPRGHSGPGDQNLDGDQGDSSTEDLVLRPANCPHHAMVYAAQPHSYRDLPVRLHELAPMFRAERSGVLSGLSRVRQISLDDTHVFCRPDQVVDEVVRALRSALHAQQVLGLPVDSLRLSRRGPSGTYLGGDEQWQHAEQALREAAGEVLAGRSSQVPAPGQHQGLALEEVLGEAAFYGPKLDLQVHDERGQEQTIATVQLDFAQPERFNLTYTGTDGLAHPVVMVHRGTVGSMERVVAAVLEHHQGRVPLWLAPVQVCLLPVSSHQEEAARALQDRLSSIDLRVRLEAEGSLGARIRSSRSRRDSLIGVIGDHEAEDMTVEVTDPALGYRARLPQEEFLSCVRMADERRALRVQWPQAVIG